jgi:ribonucleoside-diphosphate reductase alpha chain
MTVEQWLGKDNSLGIDIWNRKYKKNNETFDEWLDRVSGNNEAIKALIIEKKFIPGGRILSNRGITDTRVTYSNCYVITPPEDNIESIFESRKKLARTYSYGGGCGIDLSKLAPAGAKVHNQAEQTTGAVSFMQGYSQTTEEIGQAGRRGALMISLDCHHPDLLDFIDAKTSPDAVTKANISVRVTDDFMEAVINDKDWIMSFTRPETNETITKTARAREIFEKLCKNNWDWGEPGILFWDTISNYNLLEFDDTFEYAGVNPCAEEPLPAGGSCLLSSINLSAFVKDKEFDFDDFSETVANGVIYLNEVLEEGLSLHPLEEQRQSVADWRQIGLGIMGLADMLIKMELPYDSEQARQLCEEIGLVMADQALYTSAFLAGHAGSYNNYKSCIQKSEFLKNNTCESTREVIEAYGLRNSQLLTIAPTGTISTMLGISGGIEPIFANSYTRKTESLHGHDEYYKVYTPIVKEYMDEHGIKDETELPNWFCTSSTISPLNRVLMQGVWQKHIDASISSTVNLPEEATIKDVEEIYLNAWKEGLKGITVFRNGCKRLGILTTNNSQEKEEEKGLSRGEIISCSDNLIGMKRRLTTGCGSLHCTAWFDPQTGDLMEIYLNKGSTGGCANFMVGLSRMISLACRGGVKIEDIADQLQSTGACPSYASRTATKHDTSKGACCPMAVGNALMEMWKEMKERIEKGNSIIALANSNSQIPSSESRSSFKPEADNGAKCPECGSELIQEGGCVICKSCGWSRCG